MMTHDPQDDPTEADLKKANMVRLNLFAIIMIVLCIAHFL